MQDILDQAAGYRNQCSLIGGGHYMAGKTAARRHTFLGIPTTVTTAVVGTSIFATLESNPSIGWKVVAGLLAFLAAVLSALHTFFNFAKVAEKHKIAGAAYGALRRELDGFFLRYEHSSGIDRDAALEELERIGKQLGELAQTSPDLPDKFYYAAQASHEASK